eukprot:g21482.t1
MEDSNLWAIQEFVATEDGARRWGKVLGHMIVYVDDVLMLRPKNITEAASSTIQSRWSTSSPEYASIGGDSMRFLGIEIRRLEDGTYLLHQECYAREVLERHPGVLASPFIKVPEGEEDEEAASLPKVREAQKITGELLWLSGKTRPDLAWAVMKMAQSALKRPRWTVELGKALLAYVKSSLDFGLHYTSQVPEDSCPDLQRVKPRHSGTLEVLVDASFSPGDGHSISGTIVLLAGCPIQWESKKQSLMALSTAEAELTAIVDGLQTGRISVKECSKAGCTQKDLHVTMDANWRWIHTEEGYQNCYSGDSWDTTVCTDPEVCAKSCAVEGLDTSKYETTYGVTQIDGGVKLGFVTGSNVGSRLYLLEDENYKMFKLKNREFAVDVDASQVQCGMNGAMYFVEMDAAGGKGLGSNKALRQTVPKSEHGQLVGKDGKGM